MVAMKELDNGAWAWLLTESDKLRTLADECFPFVDGDMEVKPLWIQGSHCFCRINWWRRHSTRASYIAQSEFVAIRLHRGQPVSMEIANQRLAQAG